MRGTKTRVLILLGGILLVTLAIHFFMLKETSVEGFDTSTETNTESTTTSESSTTGPVTTGPVTTGPVTTGPVTTEMTNELTQDPEVRDAVMTAYSNARNMSNEDKGKIVNGLKASVTKIGDKAKQLIDKMVPSALGMDTKESFISGALSMYPIND
jgi:hypothetical protein